MSHKNASYVDEIIGTLSIFKPEVWQEQADAKRADRKNAGEKNRNGAGRSLFFSPAFLRSAQ
jgi:hypothetical protein